MFDIPWWQLLVAALLYAVIVTYIAVAIGFAYKLVAKIVFYINTVMIAIANYLEILS